MQALLPAAMPSAVDKICRHLHPITGSGWRMRATGRHDVAKHPQQPGRPPPDLPSCIYGVSPDLLLCLGSFCNPSLARTASIQA